MPTPRENTLALIEAGAFLLEVSQEPELPNEFRRRAQGIVDQFPSFEQLRRASKDFGALPLESVDHFALGAHRAEPHQAVLTEAAKENWHKLRPFLVLSTEEKEKLSEDFFSNEEMQEVVRLDEQTLSHHTEHRWFVAVAGCDGKLIFPRFQVHNRKPIDAACEVFSLFDRYADGWDDPWLVVAWFYRSNEQLGMKAPVDMLRSDGEAVVEAAASDLAVERLDW